MCRARHSSHLIQTRTRNNNFKAGPGSCSPYQKLKAKPSTSQSTAPPLSDSAITVRNLKRHLLALPSIPAAQCKGAFSSGHAASLGKCWSFPPPGHCPVCQERTPAVVAGAAQHRQNTGPCLWDSLAWLHSSPCSVVLDSGEKGEMWVSC